MRSTLLLLIKLLHDEMRSLTLRAGVHSAIYDAVVADLDRVLDDELNNLHVWLQEIRDEQYAKVDAIWMLHPMKKWDYYFMMEATDMREMQLLQSRFQELRNIWKKPYATQKEKSAQPNANA